MSYNEWGKGNYVFNFPLLFSISCNFLGGMVACTINNYSKYTRTLTINWCARRICESFDFGCNARKYEDTVLFASPP